MTDAYQLFCGLKTKQDIIAILPIADLVPPTKCGGAVLPKKLSLADMIEQNIKGSQPAPVPVPAPTKATGKRTTTVRQHTPPQ